MEWLYSFSSFSYVLIVGFFFFLVLFSLTVVLYFSVTEELSKDQILVICVMLLYVTTICSPYPWNALIEIYLLIAGVRNLACDGL